MLCLVTVGSTIPPAAHADSPAILKMFRQSTPSEVVADQDLRLKPEDGPWLILATSFEGAESQERANKMAREFRDKHGWKAYVFPKQFDYSQNVMGSGIDEVGRQKKFRYADDRKVEGYGILIGDFSSREDPKLKETLDAVKRLQPESLASPTTTPDSNVSAFKKWYRSLGTPDEAKPNGPMAYAFVTRNPLLPEDFFNSPLVDKFVESLNRNADYSLLKAKGRFTVRIAMFRGADMVVLQDSRAAQEASTNGAGDGLEMAAFQANLAAKTLRQAGIEAYEFHDRTSSMVTVGTFDSLGSEDAQHRFSYALDIQQKIQEFGGAKEYRPTQYGPAPVPKNLLDIVNYKKIPELNSGSEAEKLRRVKQYSIPFDLEPKPMSIPRPETSKIYMNSLLGRN